MEENLSTVNDWDIQNKQNSSIFDNENVFPIYQMRTENDGLLLNKVQSGNNYINNMNPEERQKLSSFSKYISETSKWTLRKTSLCRYWLKGACTKLYCDFAHGDEELQSTPNIWKTTICKHWRLGSCPNGDTCRHAHGEDELQHIEPRNSILNFSSNRLDLSPKPNFSNTGSQSSVSNSRIIKNIDEDLHKNLYLNFSFNSNGSNAYEKENKDNKMSSDLKSLLQLVETHLLMHIENNNCNECSLLKYKLSYFLKLQNETRLNSTSTKLFNYDVENFETYLNSTQNIQKTEFDDHKNIETLKTYNSNSLSTQKDFNPNYEIYSLLNSLNFFDQFESNFKNIPSLKLNNNFITSNTTNELSTQIKPTISHSQNFLMTNEDDLFNMLHKNNCNKINYMPTKINNKSNDSLSSTHGESYSTKFSISDFSIDGETTDEEANINKHSLNTDFYLSLLYHNQLYK